MAETNIRNVPSLKTFCKTLVDACGATYIAAAEQTLSLASPVVYFHVPAGHDQKRSARELLRDQLGEAGIVRHESHRMRVDLRHVGHEDVHAFGRVPLYVQGVSGLEDVSLQDGMETAHRYLAGEVEVTRPPSETIELERLVEELAAEGAAAVELRNNALLERNVVDLRVPMVPATGHDIVGPYTHVTVGGAEYLLRVDFTFDGPGGYGAMRTPLYVGENVHGLAPVTTDEGMHYFSKVRAIETAMDDDQHAHQQLRELEFNIRSE